MTHEGCEIRRKSKVPILNVIVFNETLILENVSLQAEHLLTFHIYVQIIIRRQYKMAYIMSGLGGSS